ncbi:dihydroxyacetone kinase family protein [Brevibacterium sp. XM4083]|uniref:dihydroxyacetone kinase family protein n=1 Tax=Brevibacterium sp. XM4083 TaxID=2583238 RepID=UPI00112900DB|nr:dihydroxyacetone kinase family protein [Brevibacterium sp. XM4083]
MARLFNDPNDFVADMSRGLSLAAARWVRAVPGGVVRSTRAAAPTVSLVIGGGSGHFPAFSGLVGPGLAHGAAMGNVFASPSTKQILSVARASDQGRGVLFSYGNYAGDVLNFDQAQEQLRAAGIDTRTVVVTDDIFSAPADEIDRRRGIAGDLAVFKIAGAAAEAGLDLSEVERLAASANDRTRSIGVAFSGCTLPGADAPLFTVPDGRMAVGLGIHGEPGIDDVPLPSASELAELLVTRLLSEAPVTSGRIVPILNGLGTVKYEELYLLYGLIDPLLREAGLVIVDPEVGEFCTSFDMAGLSLTLVWLDDELAPLWDAPCSSAAFTRGALGVAHERVEDDDATTADAGDRETATRDTADPDTAAPDTSAPAAAGGDAGGPRSTARSRALGREIAAVLTRIAGAVDDASDDLGHLDSIAGDGDHGIGMQRGSKAAALEAEAAAAHDQSAGAVLRVAGEAWADVGGGTSGAIWGRILSSLAAAVDDDPTPEGVAAVLATTLDDVRAFGKVEVGDKTLVDALAPLADEFAEAVAEAAAPGSDSSDRAGTGPLPRVAAAAARAAHAADRGADSTAELVARRGRARSHGDKSLGTPDPGAVSLAMIASVVAEELTRRAAPLTTSPPLAPTEGKATRS